jgi:type VI secretion system protein ImpM
MLAGWYGKLPCLGDFASRRLASDFIESWDAWLQRSIATSRRQLGEQWLDLFLTSPMWRFALGPGVCGDEAWAGLLVASVDKVGRYFPLTMAVELEPATDSSAIFGATEWYARLEATALAALSVDFSVEQLEAELAANPFPAQVSRIDGDASADAMAAWLATSAAPYALSLEGSEPLEQMMRNAGAALFRSMTSGKSFWWTVSPETGATAVHCAPGLPPDDYYAMLLGASAQAPGEAPSQLSQDPLQAFGFEEASDGSRIL